MACLSSSLLLLHIRPSIQRVHFTPLHIWGLVAEEVKNVGMFELVLRGRARIQTSPGSNYTWKTRHWKAQLSLLALHPLIVLFCGAHMTTLLNIFLSSTVCLDHNFFLFFSLFTVFSLQLHKIAHLPTNLEVTF